MKAKKKKGKLDQILEILGNHSKKFLEQDDKFVRIFNILDKHSKKFLENDDRFVKMDAKIDAKFNQVLTGNDKIIGILEKIRDEQTVAKGKDREQDKRLDNLDTRVKVLETSHV